MGVTDFGRWGGRVGLYCAVEVASVDVDDEEHESPVGAVVVAAVPLPCPHGVGGVDLHRVYLNSEQVVRRDIVPPLRVPLR